jgi:hypothetical protein
VTPYEHTQIGHVAICALLVPAVLFGIGAISQASPDREISLTISILFLITIALFYKLTIKICNETLCASFGVGIIRKRVPVTEIATCEPIRIRWWYGWGIRLTPHGWLYNVSGWNAVAITLRNGRKFLLDTDDPHGLAETIRCLIDTR